MEIKIKLSEKEKEKILKYAKSHSLSIEEVTKKALFEKLENEYEIYLAEKIYFEYMKNEKNFCSISKNK
ncbi:DUF6290 domain-containing protein [Streptobacillus felis]|uniref:Antitoxin n=1 Tax=Streptobacillus felis TaxID=1384509 RepID=A0A7Z0PF99_9FUSO|nr:DUF6290 family protein [Streptobacillus felis]NYV27482.1 antitoxin [Streptobacillus felis]